MKLCLEKSALITGSGRNIGRAIALDLVKRGYAIILNSSKDQQACEDATDEIAAAGGETIIAMGDIGVRRQTQSVAKTATKK